VRRTVAMLLTIFAGCVSHATAELPRHIELSCHRTANEDVPENTLESLEQAALLGCDVVEVDIRRTLDGKLVLNHDGFLERLSDGVGDVEETYYDDLRLRDAGGWMSDRFQGMQIPLFEDALRFAHDKNLRLYLDMKDKGMGADILALLKREDMLERVQFGDPWGEIKPLYPQANQAREIWVGWEVTVAEVKRDHDLGKLVIANFSANGHGMDLAAMKAAVAAGVDGINVDYPRLGADAAGRPVERILADLAEKANRGDSSTRVQAILTLSHYRGFALEGEFAHWLLDPDNHVSRAAAVALATARPRTSVTVFADALQSKNADARANAAWALGVLHAPAEMLLPLLRDGNAKVLEETLIALAHMPGDVPAKPLLTLLSDPVAAVRAAAAVALAAHQPEVAATAVPAQLNAETKAALTIYDAWAKRGKPALTDAEKAEIVVYYRCQVKEVLAVSMLKGPEATRALELQAFRPGKDFAEMNGIMSAFQLWDRIGADAQPAVQALATANVDVADRAEWMLIQGGRGVLPDVRQALNSENDATRERAIRIVAWQGDTGALPDLQAIKQRHPADADLAAWAIEKIQLLHPKL
jgi:glycerophosphoryl diester phosphodiesterase